MLFEELINATDIYDYVLGGPDCTALEDEIIDTRRWHVRHRVVLQRGDETVAVEYNVGATEYQDDTEPDIQ